jgi:hypothetical protein
MNRPDKTSQLCPPFFFVLYPPLLRPFFPPWLREVFLKGRLSSVLCDPILYLNPKQGFCQCRQQFPSLQSTVNINRKALQAALDPEHVMRNFYCLYGKTPPPPHTPITHIHPPTLPPTTNDDDLPPTASNTNPVLSCSTKNISIQYI